MAGGFDRIGQGLDDVLRGEVEFGNIGKVLGDGLSGNRQLRAINEVGVIEEVFHQSWDASNFVKVLHHVLPGRSGSRVFSEFLLISGNDVLQICQERRLVSNGLEIVNR